MKMLSPLCISNGMSDFADVDIIRDYEGNLFIPATSVAGAFRAYLGDNSNEAGQIFGFTKRKEERTEEIISKQSNLILYDIYFPQKVNTDIRDGIRLDCKKQVCCGNKYDFEVILPEQNLDLKMELNVGLNMDKQVIINSLKKICVGIQGGEIRFGYKKNRGYGQCGIEAVYIKEYNKNENRNPTNNISVDQWIYFDILKDYDSWELDMVNVTKEWLSYADSKKSIYSTLKTRFSLDGGISIRHYSASMETPDFSQITIPKQKGSSNIPVIPGTSWSGAIRHCCRNILEELKVKETVIDNMLKTIFGYVEEMKKEASASAIVVNESRLRESKPMITRRTKIDRFTAAPIHGQLYDELTYCTGKTNLEIKIKREKGNDWIIGLLLLVIKEIQNGYLAVGGQTAIGRGIFLKDAIVELDGESVCEDYYFQVLHHYLTKEEKD